MPRRKVTEASFSRLVNWMIYLLVIFMSLANGRSELLMVVPVDIALVIWALSVLALKLDYPKLRFYEAIPLIVVLGAVYLHGYVFVALASFLSIKVVHDEVMLRRKRLKQNEGST